MVSIRKFFIIVIVASSVALAGCGAGGEITYDSAQDAFERGMEQYEAGNYDRAIDYFRGVFTYGRASEYADDAQLYLARSYKGQRQYRVAATEFSRFIELYPADQRVPEAEFERAMAYYELSPPYQLDQTDTEQALSYFQLFMARHSTHELAAEAEERIQELRNKLARKKFEAGRLYERRNQYQAAVRTYEGTFDRYPETDWADNAILALIRTYIAFAEQSVEARQPERLEQALEWYQRMAQVFPDSPLLKDAEEKYERAAARLERLGHSASLAGGASE